MKRALILIAFNGCVPNSDPPWQLAHDRIVAVRVEPPALLPGEVGLIAILRAHAAAPTTIDAPTLASAPGPLFTAVHFNINHWQIDGPDEAQLADARAQLGLAADAPVPLDVELRSGDFGPAALYATKRVLLGVSAQNPVLPPVEIDGHTPAAEITVGGHRDVRLVIEATNVRWLTSCGELRDDAKADTTLVLDGACTGELVVVVRDGAGGVVWQVWPLTVL